MTEPRKASDVILAMEVKLNTLLQIVSVYDLNTKLILDRVNKIYLYLEDLKKMDADSSQFIQPSSEIIKSNNENLMIVDENPTGFRRTSRAETYVTETEDSSIKYPIQMAPATDAVKKPRIEGHDGNEKKVPVIQRVTDPTGKDLFMAEVNILNSNKELIQKTKTNAAGKWQAYLKPGQYSVHIIKTDTATKKKFEGLQEINVADSNAPLKLPIAIIKK